MNNNLDELIQNLPDNLKQFVDSDNPREKRLLSARAAIPLVPKDLAQVLFILTRDEDEEISKEAGSSLKDIPGEILMDILSDTYTHPEFLDYVAKNMGNEKYNQAILLNKSTDDSTFIYLARHEQSHVNLDIIANNKKRILRSDMIVEALSNNHAVSRSTLDEVLSFLNLHLNTNEYTIQQEEKADTDSDQEQYEDSGEQKDDSIPGEEEYDESFFDDYEIDQEYIEDQDDEEPSDLIRESAYSLIQTLKMGEKLKIALQGNMETRRILIKDNNTMIASAVLKNPRITDMEIILFSQSKVVDEEILRKISESRKWTRLHQVKSSLVNNPKTPVHISLNLLRHLRDHELRKIMVDKNLPGAVTSAARNIVRTKK